jgi:hypothetical protein
VSDLLQSIGTEGQRKMPRRDLPKSLTPNA